MAESTVVYIPAANPTGSGVANRVSYWTAAGTLGSAAGFTFDGTGTLTLSVAVVSPIYTFSASASASTGYLTSTTHATKGKYFLNSAGTITVDELNTRIGIGIAVPAWQLHVSGTSTSFVAEEVENLSTGTGAYSFVSAKNSVSNNRVFMLKNSSGFSGTEYGETAASLGKFLNQTTGALVIGNLVANRVAFIANSLPGMYLESNLDIVLGNKAAIATGATAGHGYILKTSAGAPTGVPGGAYTGQAVMQFDTTNKKLYIWDPVNAAWFNTLTAATGVWSTV